MKITQAGHYIVRIRGSAGIQYAHMELPADYETDSHGMIEEITAGPETEAIGAWSAHRVALKAKATIK